MLNSVGPEFLAAVAARLPEMPIIDADDSYLSEPRGSYTGQAAAVAKPNSAEQVSAILRLANEHRVGVVPYGGGTGLVGGQVMPDGPVPLLLSLERMDQIRAIHPEEGVIIAEAGTILADIQSAAERCGMLFPLSLASEGSCRIGGNLATNAGGVNVLRYGNARDLCLGLEAVLPNGDVWHGLKRLRKDNTGYDLRNLLIGAEGTLGVITAASLRMFARPRTMDAALFVVRNPEAAIDLLALAREQMGEAISAFELMHRQGLEFLAETMPQVRLPFQNFPEWMVLIDLGVAYGQNAQQMLEVLFETAHEAGLVRDGIFAQSEAQRQQFWTVRETIPEANRHIGAISSHDISVPISRLPDFIKEAGQAMAAIGNYRINCFGHVGDGNLHYNVFPPKGKTKADFKKQRALIMQTVHDVVHKFDGSVSAEHGIGRLKVDDLERYGDPVKLATMRAIKAALDPNGIMNPGAVLRT